MDNGWAWIVCMGTFMVLLLETGMVKALGVCLPALQEHFVTHTWVIGLIISLQPGLGAVSCMFGGTLSKIFSPRIAMVTFGLLSFIGLIVASFAESIPLLILGVILSGFTLGVEAISMAALPLYFYKYYDLANGISHAGISIGFMFLPPLTQFLLDLYGWRGTLLILGGLNAHLIVSAALFGPIGLPKTAQINVSQTAHPVPTASPPTKLSSKTIIKLADLDLFLDIDFVCLVCISAAGGYHYTGWVIYFVPHCQNLGFLAFESAFLASMGGVGNLVGAIAFPIAGKCLTGKAILYAAALITTLGFAVDPVMSMLHSYFGIMVSSFAVNFGFAVSFCCLYKQLVLIVKEDKFVNAVSWLTAGYSIGSISSGFLSGWLYDKSGNYITSFLILSMVSILSVTPWLISDFKKAVTRDRHYDYSVLKNTDTENEERFLCKIC